MDCFPTNYSGGFRYAAREGAGTRNDDQQEQREWIDADELEVLRSFVTSGVHFLIVGGLFWGFEKGIALGCPLSPVMGAFFLRSVDQELSKLGLFYVRFMDDIVVLAPTRWKLRGAVKAVNQTMGALRLAKHPGKTFIGRIEKGFDFLGYHFSPQGLTLARQTMVNFLERAIRLYEQEPGEGMGPRLGAHVRRWEVWARAGLAGCAGIGQIPLVICSRAFISHFAPAPGRPMRNPALGDLALDGQADLRRALEVAPLFGRRHRRKSYPRARAVAQMAASHRLPKIKFTCD